MKRATVSIARRRLAAQRISTTSFTAPEEVVAWLGAVQAQDYLGALWAVGLRLDDACEADVERALAERRIVRTWPMRGTLHFVAADDARWITELLAPRAAARATARLEAAGIDGPVLAKARRALVKNLEGGRRLTRPAAYRVLDAAKVPTEGPRGLYVLWCLAHERLLCFGPRQGKQQTFVLFDEWLPRAKGRPREEALAALAVRYFAGHGPATLADFAWWSGLKRTDARHAVLLAGKEIEEEAIDGKRYLSASRAAPPAARRPRRAHLLPAFDELLVGYADRHATIDAADGISRPAVVVDGRVVGTWKRVLGSGVASFTTTGLEGLSRAKSRDVGLELGRYARFLGLEPAGPAP